MNGSSAPSLLELEFCGDRVLIANEGPFCLGARADLSLDDPPALPDSLIELRARDGLWMVRQLVAGPEVMLRDRSGHWQAVLETGRGVPLVFEQHVVSVSTGRAFYEVELRLSQPVFGGGQRRDEMSSEPLGVNGTAMAPGAVASGPRAGLEAALTFEQRVLLTVLAAPVLRRGAIALSEIPSSVQAARELGWPVTKFNRKLDTVCGRLSRLGIGGLHGGADQPALNRRTRLVQTAVAEGLITQADLALLVEVSPQRCGAPVPVDVDVVAS